MNEQTDNSITVKVTHLESASTDALQRKSPVKPLFDRCHIHLHCKRKRLADPDGLSCKSIIDGLVKSGILTDDSSKFIEKISFSQEKIHTKKNENTGQEETIITIQKV
jgi:hypothetical protein